MSAKVLYLLAITTLTVSAKALAMEAPSAIAVNQNDQEILLREKAMYGSNEVQDISGNTLDISEPQIEEEAGVVDSIFGKGTQERIVQSVNNWVAQKAKTNPGCIERFICESYKSSESMSGIPYLAMSVSNAAVSFYQKVIQTLVFLLVVQIISWFPWQFFTLYDAFVLYLNNGSFDADSVYTHIIGPILYDVKYYFVFTGSALNPILYGYRSDTMRKAFKLTFPCFFKKKANFVIVRGNKGNQATALFKRVDIKMNSMVSKTIIHEGVMGLAPIMAHGVMTSGYNKPKSLVVRDAFFHERNKRSWPKRMNITKSYSTGQIADRVVSMDLGDPKADQGHLFYKMPITPEPVKKSSALNQAAQGLLTIPKKIKRRISVTSPKPQGSPILDMMRMGSSQGPTASSSFEDITKDTALTPANSISRDMSDNDKVMDEDKKMEFNLERLQQMLHDLKLREMTKSMLTYRPSGRRYTK